MVGTAAEERVMASVAVVTVAAMVVAVAVVAVVVEERLEDPVMGMGVEMVVALEALTEGAKGMVTRAVSSAAVVVWVQVAEVTGMVALVLVVGPVACHK